MPRSIIRFLCAFFALLILSSCARPQKTRYNAQFLTLFNTVTQIVAYGDDRDEFEAHAQFIHDDLEKYHQLFDIYNEYPGVSNIKTVNDAAGQAPVKVSREIIDLLIFAKEMHAMTDGRINIAMGSVLSIWHDYRQAGVDDPENAELPPRELLEEAAKHTDINDVVIDEAASTVYLADPLMSLDVGGIAKGYATEQVSLAAQERGFDSGLISVGGNIRALGSKDGRGEPWNLGIQNPEASAQDDSLRTVYITDKSLVTSGVYQRYYTVNGKEYHHIIDPETLMPSEYLTAVTVLCRDSGMADAITTALFNMNVEDGKKLLSLIPDAQALWVLPDGSIEYSDGFEDYTRD